MHVTFHESFIPFAFGETFLVSFTDHGDGFTAERDEFIGLHETRILPRQVAFTRDEKVGRVADHVIPFLQGDTISFFLFHVPFQADKVLVVEVSHLFYRENLPDHLGAGAAPGGIAVHEDEFVLFLGFLQCLFPGPLEEADAFSVFLCHSREYQATAQNQV